MNRILTNKVIINWNVNQTGFLVPPRKRLGRSAAGVRDLCVPRDKKTKRSKNMNRTKLYYESRINTLTHRDPVANANIINKLKRKAAKAE